MAKSEFRSACLVVFIGLPGSGKTGLCKSLLTHFASKELKIQMEHFCYDENLEWVPSDTEWRKARDNIMRTIHLKAQKLTQQNVGTGKTLLFLIDDNMYYQSMRRLYYKLSRKENYGYCQVYLKCDKNVAIRRVLERNIKSKNPPLPAHVIEKMSGRLEEPDDTNPWDESTLVIDTSSEVPAAQGTKAKSPGFLEVMQKLEKLILQEVAKPKVIQPSVKAAVDKSQDQAILLQTLDVALRKEVSKCIAAAKHTKTTYVDLKLLAQTLNSKKKLILESASRSKQSLNSVVIENYVEKFMLLSAE